MPFLTKHLQRMIPVALLVMGGCAQSVNRVTLHLDGWRLLTSEDVPGIVPPQRFWRNTTTGTVLTFSEHTPYSSEKDITAALAGVLDGAVRQGVLPDKIERATLWGLPTLRLDGRMRRDGVDMDTTHIIAFGEQTSYTAILFEYTDAPPANLDQLISITENPNHLASATIQKTMALIEPRLPGIRSGLQANQVQ
jgi:hypothetical protein